MCERLPSGQARGLHLMVGVKEARLLALQMYRIDLRRADCIFDASLLHDQRRSGRRMLGRHIEDLDRRAW